MKQTFINLNRDARGVSEVLGGVLMFGLILTMLVVVQINAVPVETRATEFDHNQRVQSDLLDFEHAVMDTARTGVSSSTSIEMGVRYPSRMFLLSPPESAGSLRTVDLGDISIENAEAVSPGAARYWDGSTKTFTTTGLEYVPSYNQYDAAPTTRYEHAITANSFGDDTAIVFGAGGIVNDRDITLYVLSGDFDRSAVDVDSLELTPVSGQSQSIAVTGTGSDSITIQLQTQLPESTWEELLADQPASMSYQSIDGGPNVVEITLDPDQTYTLHLAHVKIGTASDNDYERAEYISTVAGDNVTVAENNAQAVTFQVRNQFNGPVAGETVTVTTTGSGTLDNSVVKTDENGMATVTYTSVTPETAVIEARIDASASVDTATATVNVIDPTPEPIGLGDLVNPSEEGSVVLRSSSSDGGNITMTFENTGTVDRTFDEGRINFYHVGPPGLGKSPSSRGVPVSANVSVSSSTVGTVEVAGKFSEFTPSISIAGNDSVEVVFVFDGTKNFEPEASDYFILSIVFGNGDTAMYFVTG